MDADAGKVRHVQQQREQAFESVGHVDNDPVGSSINGRLALDLLRSHYIFQRVALELAIDVQFPWRAVLGTFAANECQVHLMLQSLLIAMYTSAANSPRPSHLRVNHPNSSTVSDSHSLIASLTASFWASLSNSGM